MEKTFTIVLFFAMALCASSLVKAADSAEWKHDALSGSQVSEFTNLEDGVVKVGIDHKSDLMAVTGGGIQNGTVWLANTELAVSLDLEKLIGLNSSTILFQYHAQHGNQDKDFNGHYVGSFAGVDNIETGTSTGQFYQAWLQKNFADDAFSALLGLYAIDSEFYITDASGLFLQPPYGMSAEMAQAGQNGPPVFPLGALALRLKYSSGDLYIQGVISDGVPGDPLKSYGTQVKLDKADGTLSVVELGQSPTTAREPINKTALGLWSYSTPAYDLVEKDASGNFVRREDRGLYILAERTLYAEQHSEGQGLSGFIRFGTVNKDVYQADWSGSVGFRYQGLLDGRDDDEVGVAVTVSHASDKYRKLTSSEASETIVEITYREQILPWLAMQPSIQRIINPNMDKSLSDAAVAGIRFELSL